MEKLLRYGFRKEVTLYRYEKDIDEEFFLCLDVLSPYDSKLSILDKELKEEYIPYFSHKNNTDFLLSMENKVKTILKWIEKNCYQQSYLPRIQGDRVLQALIQRYHDVIQIKDKVVRMRRIDNHKEYLAIFQKPKDKEFYVFFSGDDMDIDGEFLFPPFVPERKFNLIVPLDGRVPDSNLISMLEYSRVLNG